MKPKQYPVRQDTQWLDPKFKPGSHILATKALPFFLGNGASRVHRPRSVTLHLRDGEYSHTSVQFYCGNSGFAGHHRGKLTAVPPTEFGVCERCEREASRIGLPSSSTVAGIPVRTIPTKRKGSSLTPARQLSYEEAARKQSRAITGNQGAKND